MAIGGIGRSCCTYFCFSSSSGLGIRRILKGLDRNARKGVVLRKGMIFRFLILQKRYRDIPCGGKEIHGRSSHSFVPRKVVCQKKGEWAIKPSHLSPSSPAKRREGRYNFFFFAEREMGEIEARKRKVRDFLFSLSSEKNCDTAK